MATVANNDFQEMLMAKNALDTVTPREEHLVDFYGDPIPVALVQDGDLYVPIL